MTAEIDICPAEILVEAQPAEIVVIPMDPITREYLTDRDPYEGDYTITPTGSSIVLSTEGKRMTGDITINPIPNNYGLIAWDGSVMTIT